MSILVRPVRVNLASDILRHSSALFCDILLLYSPDSAILSDMPEICGSFFPVRILAGGSCEMRESPAEGVRVGNYGLIHEMVLKGRGIIEDENKSTNSQKEIIALVKNIRYKKLSIDALNEDIVNTVPEENMDEEMQRSTDLDIKIDTELEILKSYLATLSLEDMQNQGERSINSSGRIGRKQNAVRLPKLEVKKFCGDPTLWPEFLGTFNECGN